MSRSGGVVLSQYGVGARLGALVTVLIVLTEPTRLLREQREPALLAEDVALMSDAVCGSVKFLTEPVSRERVRPRRIGDSW